MLMTLMVLSTICVQTPAPAAQEQQTTEPVEMVTEVVPLANASCVDVVNALRGLNYNVDIVPIQRTNAIVLRGVPTSVQSVLAVIREIDVPAKEGPAESQPDVRVIPIDNASVNELSAIVQSTLRVSGKPKVNCMPDKTRHAVVVVGAPVWLDAAEDLIRSLDQPRPLLEMEFYFLTASLDDSETEGAHELPEALRSVASALSESGFRQARLLAPIRITTEGGADFQQTAYLRSGRDSMPDDDRQLSFAVEGVARSSAESSLFHMELQVGVTAKVATPGSNVSGWVTQHLFSTETRVTAKLDEFIILAAAPGTTPDADAIALVIRVHRR